MEKQDIREGEIVFVLSTSGRNPVPVDVALMAKEKGAFTVGITLWNIPKACPPDTAAGKHLADAVDLVIDNFSVKGDAVLSHPGLQVPFTPSSTVIGALILNSLFAESIEIMIEKGFNPCISAEISMVPMNTTERWLRLIKDGSLYWHDKNELSEK